MSDEWNAITRRLTEYGSAVLTGRDAEGYPYSVRCAPRPEAGSQSFLIAAPPGALLQAGPASLLCHKHDDWLWHQRSFLARGTLERDGEGWRFRPRHFVPGIGEGGALGLVRFVVGARRATSRYLATRGLPRPTVPWEQIQEIKRAALLNLAIQRALSAPIVESTASAKLPAKRTPSQASSLADEAVGTAGPATRPWVALALALAVLGALVALGMLRARRGRR
jgi:hypothetical protein